MKLDTRKSVLTNAKGRVIDFDLDIMSAGHLTAILRDQIYSKKELAVGREYVTNALDEHSKYNIDKPITISLPTVHNSYVFRVRDYAMGLSSDDVENVYIKYGASTKRDNNTQAGSFGIGAKVGFCWGDTFYIKSYHQGQCHEYMAALTNDTGRLHHISSSSIRNTLAHDEQGLEITVPIGESNAISFIDEVMQYLNYIPRDLAETCKGNQLLHEEHWLIKEDNILFQSDESSEYAWQFYDHNNNPLGKMYNNAVVVMGNVPYAIDANMIKEDNKYLVNQGLVFHAPLGSLSIAANREQLQYNDRTILTLQEINKDISRTIISRMNKTVQDASSYKEALKLYSESRKAIDPNLRTRYNQSSIWNNIPKDIAWNGHALQRHTELEGKTTQHVDGVDVTTRVYDYNWMPHERKTSYTRSNNPAYTWEKKHNTTETPAIITYYGVFNRIVLWNPEEHTESRMKQLVGYNHKKAEPSNSSSDKQCCWNIVYPTGTTTYDDLKLALSYLGDLVMELKDLPAAPRQAPILDTTSDGTPIPRTPRPAKGLCLIDHSESLISERLNAVILKDQTDEYPGYEATFKDTATNELIYLAFPFWKNHLYLPNSDSKSTIQTGDKLGKWSCNHPNPGYLEHINGRTSHAYNYNCPFVMTILAANPTWRCQVNHSLSNTPLYGFPKNSQDKIPEHFTWAHHVHEKAIKTLLKNKELRTHHFWHTCSPWKEYKALDDFELFESLYSNPVLGESSNRLLRKLINIEYIKNSIKWNNLRRYLYSLGHKIKKLPLDFDAILSDYVKLHEQLPLLTPLISSNAYQHPSHGYRRASQAPCIYPAALKYARITLSEDSEFSED